MTGNVAKRKTATAINQWAGVVGLGVGMALALAANLTYTWPLGPVMIGTGIAAPLVLPLVLWIRSTFKVTHWADRLIRDVSVLAVAGPAAALSYQHTFTLMIDHSVPVWLAAVLPFSADGVATISTLALHRSRNATKTAAKDTQAAGKPARAKAKNLDAPALEEAAPESPNEVESRRGQRTEMVAWIRDQDEFPSIKAVAARFDCHPTTAKRARNDARAAS